MHDRELNEKLLGMGGAKYFDLAYKLVTHYPTLSGFKPDRKEEYSSEDIKLMFEGLLRNRHIRDVIEISNKGFLEGNSF